MINRADSGRWLALAIGVSIGGFSAATEAAIASGYTYAVAGNSGNPVSRTPTVTTNNLGTYASGKITGATANNASAHFTIADQFLPSLSLYAEGSDAAGFNAAYGYAEATFQYTFKVVGPQSSTPVPVVILGETYSNIAESGNTSLYYNYAGTRLSLSAPNIASTITDNGSYGSKPTVDAPFQGGADTVRIGWGADASGPQSIAYHDFFNFMAPIAVGTTGTVKLEGLARGGLTGAISPTNIATVGAASVFIDPYIEIDPTWAASNPGYSIVVESGVGNAPPSVPVPASAWLFATALSTVVMKRRADSN